MLFIADDIEMLTEHVTSLVTRQTPDGVRFALTGTRQAFVDAIASIKVVRSPPKSGK